MREAERPLDPPALLLEKEDAMPKKTKRQVCSICRLAFVEYGNNAWPVNEGRCCNICNDTVVIPARIVLMRTKPVPFNLALHDFLMGQGFSHDRLPAHWEEMGDAESGPMGLHGHEAFDEYRKDNLIVYYDEDGRSDVEVFEDRGLPGSRDESDYAFEARSMSGKDWDRPEGWDPSEEK